MDLKFTKRILENRGKIDKGLGVHEENIGKQRQIVGNRGKSEKGLRVHVENIGKQRQLLGNRGKGEKGFTIQGRKLRHFVKFLPMYELQF